MFKKSLVAVFLFLQTQVSAEDLSQSKKLVAYLTKNNQRVLAQFDIFAQNLSDAHRDNKISEQGFQRITKALNFAAKKHQFQTRKDAELTPYIIHPIGVANNVLSIGKVYDVEIIMGALLHDTVEDTGTSFEEIKQNFGEVVEGYIREVTDDKSLSKEERKRLQIVNASHKSNEAAVIKEADFAYNLYDLLHNSPPDWPKKRVSEYFAWASQVINNLPKANALLEKHLAEIIKTFHDSNVLGYISDFSNSEIIQKSLEEKTVISDTNQKIKFLSYNIQLSGLDEKGHLWADRKNAVCALLSYADVFAIQEISHEQFLDLANVMSDYEFVGFNTVTGKDLKEYSVNIQEGLVIGFNKNIFTLKSAEMKWYSDTPAFPSKRWNGWESSFEKALQIADLCFIGTEKEIRIFNSHFAHDEDPSNVVNPRYLSSKMELEILENNKDCYWISAGDRNFHHPRDTKAYNAYKDASFVSDSRQGSDVKIWGTKTTFLGYEGHPRLNSITQQGDFEKEYYLDVIFHNSKMMKNLLWVCHMGEYGDDSKLLPAGYCKQLNERLFASDHTAIFVIYELI